MPDFEALMANIGSNKGKRLRVALCRFAAMLIEEARDIAGLTFEELDHSLGLEPGQVIRYSRYPIEAGTRAPHAAGIQRLEEKVAALLKRPSHTVVIENNALLLEDWLADPVVGVPAADINLRTTESTDLQLGYEGDWPTYRRLKYSAPQDGVRLLDLYLWQYGVLWEMGTLPPEWSREAIGVPEDMPVEEFLPQLVEEAKHQRLQFLNGIQALGRAGILPEHVGHFA
ncbi:hypothetical protein [Ralstonia mojiangensis]|uniref:hypothetical protein n=1 Tax=Ralstonia mojiangensis TaxID=2953895 RepID=UPI0021B16C4A|nr:hypothetical protein [Ralstonia mojiangensis]MCT7327996.1 hypothetical protein [Ralstonia mojiangensis]